MAHEQKLGLRVCMPVHNAGEYLEEAVLSVLSDLGPDDQFVIVDDGSTDRALDKLADKLRRHRSVKVLKNEKALGVSAALNRAILLPPRPRFVAVAEHDDVVVAGRFRRQVEFLEAHPDVGVVGGLGQYLGPGGRTLATIRTGPLSDLEFEESRLACEPILVLHPSAMYRIEALDEAGYYDSTFDGSQDLDLMNRIVYNCGWKALTMPSVQVLYRIHPRATSFSRLSEQRMMTRYIKERNASVVASAEMPSYSEWKAFRVTNRRDRWRWARHDRGALLYRRAGMLWLYGDRPRALLSGVAAALLHPQWVIMKLRRQTRSVDR